MEKAKRCAAFPTVLGKVQNNFSTAPHSAGRDLN
jgi:hypothetical protein